MCRIRAPVLPRARRLDEGAAAAAVARADAQQAARDLMEWMNGWHSEQGELPEEPPERLQVRLLASLPAGLPCTSAGCRALQGMEARCSAGSGSLMESAC